jgi:3-hydroxyisobutyrate dehydrogenase/putative dehydrogenase
MAKIGWIGVGAMGAPMAARLARAGHELTAFDLDPRRVTALGDAGVRPASSLRELAAAAEVLALMVASPEQVNAVLFGDDPLADSLAADSVVLLMATVGPDAAAQAATELAARGIALVDAPVSGGVARAERGELLAMAAEPGLERVRPLLEELTATLVVVGPEVGDGQKVKLVNQLLCGVHIAAAGEALAFAEALGLDPNAVFEVIRHGAAHSFMLEDRGARMLREEFEPVRSALDIFVKDMGLVTAAARAHSYPTPLASVAQLLYLAGHRAGLGRLDDSAVIEVLRGARPGDAGG